MSNFQEQPMNDFETIALTNLSNVTGGAHDAEANGRMIGMAAGTVIGGAACFALGNAPGAVAGAGLGMAAGTEIGGYIGSHWG
jgi:hypothetical protein